MSTTIGLIILKQGAMIWNLWRKEGYFLTPDFSGANLSDADLSHTNLGNANLSHANLSHANLSHANLSHANLGNANLSRANLDNANLDNANLSHANLSRANLGNADFNSSDLSNANLSDTNLTGVCLSGAKMLNTNRSRTIDNSACLGSHSGVPVRMADFNHALRTMLFSNEKPLSQENNITIELEKLIKRIDDSIEHKSNKKSNLSTIRLHKDRDCLTHLFFTIKKSKIKKKSYFWHLTNTINKNKKSISHNITKKENNRSIRYSSSISELTTIGIIIKKVNT